MKTKEDKIALWEKDSLKDAYEKGQQAERKRILEEFKLWALKEWGTSIYNLSRN